MNKILLTGASGKLGSEILRSKYFSNFEILSPTHSQIDITNRSQVKNYILESTPDYIIHCAAMARMKECERLPLDAFKVNAVGTFNLISACNQLKNISNKMIKFIQISTDAVYPSTEGNYSEVDSLLPYNVYGWSKLAAEGYVKLYPNHIIIRTRFFDPSDIKFDSSPIDIFTSKVSVENLVVSIYYIVLSEYTGVLNIGQTRISEYQINKMFKLDLKPCTRADMIKEADMSFAIDASLNLDKWNLLKSVNKWQI